MKYCKRCLYPENHPYGIVYDSDGICSGCRVHEEKDQINWNERFDILKKLVFENSRNTHRRNFDCIVPVTGGGDSYFIVHTVKNVLGMNPLLVNYNSHYNTKVGIRNLANLATVFDCDIITSTVSPAILKNITRDTLSRYGSIYWQVLAGFLTFPVQTAVKFKIPLIIWGVHPWSEQVGMFSHYDQVEMTHRCRNEHGLFGVTAEEILKKSTTLKRQDVQPFIYPFDSELEAIGVRGIYLSNYIRWDAKEQHEAMIKQYGYESAVQQRTFNTYEDVHCFHSAGLHDYIKYIKYGYSKVTDHATRDIRLKKISRDQGIGFVNKYSNILPSDISLMSSWLDISEENIIKSFWDRRDPRIWTKINDYDWKLKDSVSNSIGEELVDHVENNVNTFEYILTAKAEPNIKDDQYLLMGRGYVDKYDYGAIEDQSIGGGLTPREWTEEKFT